MRVLGFTPIEDFVGYIAACDIILNLRFPTVGESSGTLLRSLGLGTRGASCRISDRSRSTPTRSASRSRWTQTEEDTLYEYLNLARRPGRICAELWGMSAEIGSSASATGDRSRSDTSASWRPSPTAGIGSPYRPKCERRAVEEPAPSVTIEPEYVVGWAETEDARKYIRNAHHTTGQDAGDHAARIRG